MDVIHDGVSHPGGAVGGPVSWREAPCRSGPPRSPCLLLSLEHPPVPGELGAFAAGGAAFRQPVLVNDLPPDLDVEPTVQRLAVAATGTASVWLAAGAPLRTLTFAPRLLK